jgi:dCMP deaminase
MKFHSQSQEARERDAQGEEEVGRGLLLKQQEWDLYWLGMTVAAARKSKDPSTKVGVVIVRPDNSIVSTGFNGFPRRLDDNPAYYGDRTVKLQRTIHAEVNAIQFAREKLDGYTMFASLYPCDKCALQIIQSGISRLVTFIPPADLVARWKASFDLTRDLLAEADVKVVQYDPQMLFNNG